MKKYAFVALAILSGLLTLAGFLLQPLLDDLLQVLLHWAVVIGSMAALTGIINLLAVHFKRVRQRDGRFFFSLVVIISFFITFITGLILSPQDAAFQRYVLAFQVPVEASLLAVLAFTLTFAGVRFFRLRGWTVLSISFGISALVFLILNFSFMRFDDIPVLHYLLELLRTLKLAGAKGLLIGVALGGLFMGMRVLTGIDKPYQE